MTEYTVRYLDDEKTFDSINLIATDVRHAITQFQELKPDVHMTSVLPADQWTKDENSSN